MAETTTTKSNSDFVALRAYVTAQDVSRLAALPPDTVLLDLTHSNLEQRHIEIRFSKTDPLDELRHRIYQKTGTPAQYQNLQVIESGQVVVDIPHTHPGHYPLGYFGIEHHQTRIHCCDMNPHSQSAHGGYEDVRLVEKYVMTEQEYDARPGTLRAWKKKQQQQQAEKDGEDDKSSSSSSSQKGFSPGISKSTTTDSASTNEDEDYGPASVAGIHIGDRCQIMPGMRRGRVAWVGQIPTRLVLGYWVGVVLDEPRGQNDGCWTDKQDDGTSTTRLFDTPGPKYGSFIRGQRVETGDFPERDIFDDEDEEEDEEENEQNSGHSSDDDEL